MSNVVVRTLTACAFRFKPGRLKEGFARGLAGAVVVANDNFVLLSGLVMGFAVGARGRLGRVLPLPASFSFSRCNVSCARCRAVLFAVGVLFATFEGAGASREGTALAASSLDGAEASLSLRFFASRAFLCSRQEDKRVSKNSQQKSGKGRNRTRQTPVLTFFSRSSSYFCLRLASDDMGPPSGGQARGLVWVPLNTTVNL